MGPDTALLLDLLSVVSEEIEPTRTAAASRSALYPDVSTEMSTPSLFFSLKSTSICLLQR